jgi:2-polyprenyl-3-methyl-5-hydroxy-6-metoxy-1,4-benzoquinol methylase
VPSSNPDQINEIMSLVLGLRPESVLDIGIGFGKYGFLCREYLEICYGSKKYNDWQKRIDGIEAFEEYITPLQKQIYDNIYIGDANDVLPKLDETYDLILLINILEHFSYKDGMKLLKQCKQHGLYIIMSTPKNVIPAGTGKYGNVYETARFQWEERHFNSFPERQVVSNPRKLIICVDNTGGIPPEKHPLKSIRKEKGPEYYNDIYDNEFDQTRYHAIYDRILEWVKDKENPRVLEVGCGCSDLSIMMVNNNIPYQGFDFSQKALDQLAKKSPATREKCKLANAYDDENYSGDYNTVVAVEVMEHLDDLRVLENIPPGKNVILSLPDYMAWSHLRVYESETKIRERFDKLLDISGIAVFKWGPDERFHRTEENNVHPTKKLTIYLIAGVRESSRFNKSKVEEKSSEFNRLKDNCLLEQ